MSAKARLAHLYDVSGPVAERFRTVQEDFLLKPEELNKLAEDIKANGLLEPVQTFEGKLLDGRNRLAACELAGVEPRYVEVALNGDSPTLYVMSKNLHRRHLTNSQCAAIGAEMMPMLRAEAEARKRAIGKQTGRGNRLPAKVPANLPEPFPSNKSSDIRGESRSIAAKTMGVGGRTIQTAVAVMKYAPEEHEKVKSGETSLADAHRRAMWNKEKQKAPAPPKTVEGGKRRAMLRKAAKLRLIEALSSLRGSCRTLNNLNPPLLQESLTEAEGNEWAEVGFKAARQLREFSNQLKGTCHAQREESHPDQ